MISIGMMTLGTIPLAPLFADVGDWAKVIIFIVIAVFWVIKRVMGIDGQGQKPNVRRPEAPRPVKPVAAPAERKRIDDEVGEFLRRAAQQRAGQQGAGQGQQKEQQGDKRRSAQPIAQAAVPTAPAQPARRPLVERPVHARTADTRTVEVEAVEVEVLEDAYVGRSVVDHVQQHLGARTVAQRGPPSEVVENAVQNMQAHLQQTFDHEVGHLAQRSSAEGTSVATLAPDATLPTANQLRTILGSPQGVGQAILLSEILRRPEERW